MAISHSQLKLDSHENEETRTRLFGNVSARDVTVQNKVRTNVTARIYFGRFVCIEQAGSTSRFRIVSLGIFVTNILNNYIE